MNKIRHVGNYYCYTVNIGAVRMTITMTMIKIIIMAIMTTVDKDRGLLLVD